MPDPENEAAWPRTDLSGDEVALIIAALSIAEGHWTTKANAMEQWSLEKAKACMIADDFRALLDKIAPKVPLQRNRRTPPDYT